jgi:hypothetical protein
MRPKRKPVPIRVQLEVAKRQLRFLMKCDVIQLDHIPALGLRTVNAAGTDYEPPQHDPDGLEWMSSEWHLLKTTGRKGESKLSITGNGDVSRIAKAKRIEVKRRREAVGAEVESAFPEMTKRLNRPWPQGRKIESRNDLRKKP